MKRIVLISIAFIFACVCQCTEEKIDSRSYSRLQTKPVSDINHSGATFSAQIIYNNNSTIQDRGFVWSMNANPMLTNSDSVSVGSASGDEFSATVKRGMTSGLSYYVRGYLRTAEYLVYGDVISFTSAGSETPNTITHVSPNAHVMPRGKVNVLGNFEGDITVKLNGQPLDKSLITGIKKDQFTLTLPDLMKPSNTLTVVVSGKEIEAPQKLTVLLTQGIEIQPHNVPSTICVVGSKAYYPLQKSLFALNLKSNTYGAVGMLPALFPQYASSFSINGTAYFGGGNIPPVSKVFYSVDSTTNQFTRLADLDENLTMAMFSIGSKGYRVNAIKSGNTYKNELYEFDATTKLWTKKADLPAATYATAEFFEANGKGYLGLLRNFGWDGHYDAGTMELWQYNPVTNQWTKLQTDGIRSNASFGFVSTRGKVYLAYTMNADNEYSSRFLEFDTASEKFSSKPLTTTMPMNMFATFNFDGAGHIFSNYYIWKFDMAY